ncbi:MAG: ABC transporter permease [Candidatus Bathyarchaeota archaeon]|nr:ABC transporter permease [Candidatus Bathyarchaeota archaeon]
MPKLLTLFNMAVWRHLLTLTRYKTNFIFELLTSAATGLVMLIFSVLFDPTLFREVVGSSNNVAFLILGISHQTWINTALYGAANMFRSELNSGMIDYTFSCPFSRYWYMVCNIAARAVRSTLFFIPMFCVGLYIASATVTPMGVALGLIATGLSVAVLSQLGAIFAALTLRHREITAIFGFFNIAFQFFTGMFLPFQLLPAPLQMIGYFLPQTFGMDLLRHYVIGTNLIVPETYEWTALLAQLAILGVLAKISIHRLEKTAKEQGLHYL